MFKQEMTFQLDDHPKAKRAYVWRRRQGSGEKRDDEYTVVLGVASCRLARDCCQGAYRCALQDPVTSPQTAVKVALAAEAERI